MRERRLIDPEYMAFPFRMTADGAATSRRQSHIREIIYQVIFTNPGERVFKLDFGVGANRLVFETNNSTLWEFVYQQIYSSLTEVLRGEIDPDSLEITIANSEQNSMDGKLDIRVAYRLATINRQEEIQISTRANQYG